MIVYTTVFLAILIFEVLLFLLLTSMPSLGTWGKDAVDACTKTPMLDWLLSFIILVPWLIGGLTVRWGGIVASLLAQVLAMQLWIFYHEFLNRNVAPGSRIARFHSQRIGWWRNHLALWVTSIIVPVFFLIRFSEVFVYPMLIWLLGFPKYKHSDWVNVSRHKFEGLVGHDLIWCLYCDWMTGVYSLGAEMLRNVESFWCPIKFYDGKKCENCRLDFPDLEGGWVDADGTMNDVEQVLNQMYDDRHRSWFGHPERHQDQV